MKAHVMTLLGIGWLVACHGEPTPHAPGHGPHDHHHPHSSHHQPGDHAHAHHGHHPAGTHHHHDAVPSHDGQRTSDGRDPVAGSADSPFTVDPVLCDAKDPSAERLDADGDGRAETIRVRKSGHLVCRVVDRDGDGRFDRVEVFDDTGQLRRRSDDDDSDGTPDVIIRFAGGHVVEKHIDTDGDGRFDVREMHAGGRRLRREQDTDHDGRPDAWWTDLRAQPGCVRVLRDTDGDGKPDSSSRACGR